ncbi:hypothetical protein ACLB2K_010953 [Fragaria x ananassa]
MSGLPRSSSAPLKNGLPPQELLDDLCSRFVLNVPKEDLQSFERILFLVEYAHWFYEDNSVEKNPSLKSFNLKEFTSLLFNSCDVLKPYVAHIDDIFKDFTSYKVKVPVTGAIILDETYERCILVKGWKGSSWSFPRGKKNKDEEDHACAIREEGYEADVRTRLKVRTSFRSPPSGPGDGAPPPQKTPAASPTTFPPRRVHSFPVFRRDHPKLQTKSISPETEKKRTRRGGKVVGDAAGVFWGGDAPSPAPEDGERTDVRTLSRVLEETGFDVTKLLNIDDYIEVIFGQQRVRLYIVAGVREDTAFAPLTKKEISEIAWHRLDDLQPASNDVISRGITGLKLYMVSPFLASLKSWIFKHQPPNASRPDMPLRGLSVWRAKNSSIGSSNMIMESQSTKPEPEVHPPERAGMSFRNFRFNTASIFQPMEAGD